MADSSDNGDSTHNYSDDPNDETPTPKLLVPLGQLTDRGVEGDGARAVVAWATAGSVVTTDDVKKGARSEHYIGAAAHTNNAGELSAMYYALRRVAARPRRQAREVVHTDSLYAMHMTTGRWMPRKKGRRNAPLID